MMNNKLMIFFIQDKNKSREIFPAFLFELI